MNDPLMPLAFTRTLRLKVRPESYPWLNAALSPRVIGSFRPPTFARQLAGRLLFRQRRAGLRGLAR
jgi:hypothetical protein